MYAMDSLSILGDDGGYGRTFDLRADLIDGVVTYGLQAKLFGGSDVMEANNGIR